MSDITSIQYHIDIRKQLIKESLERKKEKRYDSTYDVELRRQLRNEIKTINDFNELMQEYALENLSWYDATINISI